MSPDRPQPLRLDGTGDEAAVLLHGFTGHPDHWRPLGETLNRQGYTVVAPLLAGHGATPEALSRAAWREWVESGREAAGSVSHHRRVHLLGLSMGGLIAILLARPTAAATLTTINAPLILREKKAYLAPWARHVVPFRAGPEDEAPDPDLAHLWLPPEQRSTAAVDQLLRIMWHAWGAAGRLRRPSLVIQSSLDEAVHPASGMLLARRMRARLVEVETRHNALLDPGRETVAEAVIDHLDAARRNDRKIRLH